MVVNAKRIQSFDCIYWLLLRMESFIMVVCYVQKGDVLGTCQLLLLADQSILVTDFLNYQVIGIYKHPENRTGDTEH